MNEDWQIIECRGYKAYTEIDFSENIIKGCIYNNSRNGYYISFSSDSLLGLHSAFETAIDLYERECQEHGISPCPPVPDALPPVVFERYNRFFPELDRYLLSDIASFISNINNTIAIMRGLGLLDTVAIESSLQNKQDEILDSLKVMLALTRHLIRDDSRIGRIMQILAEDIELIVSGHEPIFLTVDPYKGTKRSNPKHKAFRTECACAVAALIRRGMTRDNACRAVHNALSNEGISISKNGKLVSARTIISHYNEERKMSKKRGPIDYNNFPSWPEEAKNKQFYIPVSNDRFNERFEYEEDMEIDLANKFKYDQNPAYPLINGLYPLENLIEKLRALSPLI